VLPKLLFFICTLFSFDFYWKVIRTLVVLLHEIDINRLTSIFKVETHDHIYCKESDTSDNVCLDLQNCRCSIYTEITEVYRLIEWKCIISGSEI